jgi:hydrogenase nickel incorporation protein HypB
MEVNMREIKVIKNILQSNEDLADNLKATFKEKGVYVINMMSSPGAGKTSILEKLLLHLKDKLRVAVIEGDIYTTKDAERIGKLDVPVVQINTEGACHLDSQIIKNACDQIDLDNTQLLIIENIGNLVCPAEFEIGENIKITVSSVTEGNDKPLKYPLMFEKAGAIVLNKIDLIEYTNFDREEFIKDVKGLNPHVSIFETSIIKDIGITELGDWILNLVNLNRKI